MGTDSGTLSALRNGWSSFNRRFSMILQRRHATIPVLAALLALPGVGGALGAQQSGAVAPARCPSKIPAPFARLAQPNVTVRIMAEGEFPDADAAAARAVALLIRDALNERGPVALASLVHVDRSISPSLSAVADLRGLPAGSKLLTSIVQRSRDSIAVTWRLRKVGDETSPVRAQRLVFSMQQLPRGAFALAELAAQASGGSSVSLGTPPPPLPSVDAANAFINGLAEALSPTPVSLVRARNLLVRASTLAPTQADIWRWRGRVEQSLIEWNTSADPAAVRGLRASSIAAASRAVQLAPRSIGAQVALAEALLATGERVKAEAALVTAAQLDVNNPGMLRVAALLNRIRGNDARSLEQLRTSVERAPREAPVLVELASLARFSGDVALSCHALNAAVAADPELASAYALRALVRAGYGELREAWADAEIATRLGHPEWGERAAAVLDARYGERTQAANRMRPLGGTSAMPLNYLDAVLLGQASVAMGQRGTVARVSSGLSCTSPLRGPLLRDLKSVGAASSDACGQAPAARAD